MGSIPNHKLLTTTLRPWKEFWAGGYVSKFTFFFLSCCKCFLAFGLNFCFGCGFLRKKTVRRMLRCVYMMLLGIPTSVFAVTLMKKLHTS